MAENDRPLEGVTVIDASQGISGPYCGAILAQQGAQVLKIEPISGDWVRLVVGSREGFGPLGIFSNLSKRSACIDFSRPEGRGVVLGLARSADIFIENFRPGVMDRLGLGYSDLSATGPGLVYVSVSAFGDSGPLVDKPGTDSVMQAFSGIAMLNRDAHGVPRRSPLLMPDVGTAVYAAQAAVAALFARTRTGRGRHVKLSLLECSLAFQAPQILEDRLSGDFDWSKPRTVPSAILATADGHIVLLALHDNMWRQCCIAIGKPEWLTDPRFSTIPERARHSDEIQGEIGRILATRPTQEWIEIFERHDVLCAKTQSYQEVLQHPQVKHMDYVTEITQGAWGDLPIPRQPFSAPGEPKSRAPYAGEHTREILAQAGYSADEISRLEQDRIVLQYVAA